MFDIISFLAGSTLTALTWQITRIGYRLWPYYSKTTNIITGKKGFVVVTGATDGIGLEFVRWANK